ncbi:hypothetical protein GGF32_009391 [Allomyces javanicus]|nr:hypothetical protein GGF32_009391 [Allomyces javanicus]
MFNPLVPPMFIDVAPCVAQMHLDPDPPAYPVCVPLVCPQECIHGTCTAAGQCACDAGHEGIACQFPADLSDTIEWSMPSPPYLSTPAMRDALLVQAQAVLPPGYAPLYRSMTVVNETAGSGRRVIRFRFAVDEWDQVVQADALVPVVMQMAEAIARFPVAKKTVFHGFAWPPSTVPVAHGPVPVPQSTEAPVATDTDVPTLTTDGGAPMTSTDAGHSNSVAPIVFM